MVLVRCGESSRLEYARRQRRHGCRDGWHVLLLGARLADFFSVDGGACGDQRPAASHRRGSCDVEGAPDRESSHREAFR